MWKQHEWKETMPNAYDQGYATALVELMNIVRKDEKVKWATKDLVDICIQLLEVEKETPPATTTDGES